MRFFITIATGLAVLLPQTAIAQTAFVVTDQSKSSASFLDLGGIKRDGAELQLQMLSFSAGVEGSQPAYRTWLATYSYSCDWNTFRMTERLEYLPGGTAKEDRQIVGTSTPTFFGPMGWQAQLGPLMCDADASSLGASFASIDTAIAEALRVTRPLPAPKTVDSQVAPTGPIQVISPAPVQPYMLPNFEKPASSRYGLVKRDSVTGNANYLDWGNFIRAGDVVHALTIDALGEVKKGAYRYSRMKLSSVEIDCKTGSVDVLAYVTFDDRLTPGYQQDGDWPARTAATWPLGGLVAAAACTGQAPQLTLPSREAVLVLQRAMPGTRPPG